PFDPLAPPPVSLGTNIAIYIGAALFGACIVAAAVRPSGNRALEWPPIAALGLISYGVFLWHQKMIDVASGRLAEMPNVVWLGAAALASVAIAAASFYLLERPVMATSTVRNRLWVRHFLLKQTET
ncbi:MAG TPA: hypothetical protein VFP56_07455, partial [Candidatus Limnocylindrales bacterium]|nr:hypothetical protein [Candidatus Limnocylindrales bacterium]